MGPSDSSATAIPKTQPSPAEPVPEEFDLLCEQCGYSLIQLTPSTTCCPECGAAIEKMLLPLARVPWLYRRRLGTWPSYWRTVVVILLRPAAFAAELRRPVRVSRADAKSFRRQSILLALLAAATGGIASGVILAADVFFRPGGGLRNMVGTSLVIGLFCLHCFLRLATDLPTFIWRGLPDAPNSLAPVQHYASAGLALCPIVAALVIASSLLAGATMPTLWVALGGVAAVALVSYFTALRLMRRAAAPARSVVLLACYLPVHVVIMFVTCVLGWATGVYLASDLLGIRF